MLVGLLSAKGSPGVTTAALALSVAWPRTSMMIDADPFGGDVRAGLGTGNWPKDAGIADLVVDLRTSTTRAALPSRLHRPADHAPLILAGIGSIGQAAGIPWSTLGPELSRLPGCDAIADCGRFVPGLSDPIVHACDAVALVTGSDLPAVRAASRTCELVGGIRRLAGIIVSGPGSPYSTAEIAQACGLPPLGDLPQDPRVAAVWSTGATPPRSLLRTEFMRAAGSVAVRLMQQLVPGGVR